MAFDRSLVFRSREFRREFVDRSAQQCLAFAHKSKLGEKGTGIHAEERAPVIKDRGADLHLMAARRLQPSRLAWNRRSSGLDGPLTAQTVVRRHPRKGLRGEWPFPFGTPRADEILDLSH
jgi:hypothetical protein